MKESVNDRMTKAKKEVDTLLKELGVRLSYEQPVFVWDEYKQLPVWTLDFYLISFGTYVEVCGSEKFDYGYRRKIFDKNGYRVTFLHLFKDSNK